MKSNKMKLINLIGKAFILLGIIMMASSYASYEKIGTLRGNANCGTRQQKDICSPTNNRGEATREKYNLIREDCITTTERICVPGKTSSGALYGESQLRRELLQSFINWQTLETSYIEEYVILDNQQPSLGVSNISVYIDIRSGYYKKIISNSATTETITYDKHGLIRYKNGIAEKMVSIEPVDFPKVLLPWFDVSGSFKPILNEDNINNFKVEISTSEIILYSIEDGLRIIFDKKTYLLKKTQYLAQDNNQRFVSLEYILTDWNNFNGVFFPLNIAINIYDEKSKSIKNSTILKINKELTFFNKDISSAIKSFLPAGTTVVDRTAWKIYTITDVDKIDRKAQIISDALEEIINKSNRQIEKK